MSSSMRDYKKFAILYNFDKLLFEKFQNKLIHYAKALPNKWPLYKREHTNKNAKCLFCKTSLKPAGKDIIYRNIKQAKACLVATNLSVARNLHQ